MSRQAKLPKATTPDKGDSLIVDVRRVRHEISAEFGHDPDRLISYYMELQKQHVNRLVHAHEQDRPGKPAS